MFFLLEACEVDGFQVRSMAQVLTVGDGDLSFSLALCRAFGGQLLVTGTTLLSQEELVKRYRSAAGSRDELVSLGATVVHQVDACHLELRDSEPFDVAIFNFPHLGDVAEDGHSFVSGHVRRHRSLMSHFFEAARQVTQEVHVTLCGQQPELWELVARAEALGWQECRRAAPSSVALWTAHLMSPHPLTELFWAFWLVFVTQDSFAQGTLASLTPCTPSAEWRAWRKFRNGGLGFVHWAARYGYEHRRHESEQLMNISDCTTFVFRAHVAPASVSSGLQCAICGQGFSDSAALAQHMQAPAQPEAVRFDCEQCQRSFLSRRALSQHAEGCGSKSTVTSKPKADGELIAEVVVETEGPRLLHWAREAFRTHLASKAIVKRAIADGELTLNGERVEDSRRLHPGDLVQLRLKAQEMKDSSALSVRLVVLGDRISETPFRVISARCPLGVAVVWKPSGMRCLGVHRGTLQSSLAPVLGSDALPLSRLEIGCSGLCLVALDAQPRPWRVMHVFRALVRGRLGEVGEQRCLEEVDIQVVPKLSCKVPLVTKVQVEETLSLIELTTASAWGRWP